jgi:UDP-2-acetamido-3-amino-2,3-dideoxy-glucuronate N-acetyltransferase
MEDELSQSLVSDIQVIDIPTFADERGALSVLQSGMGIPFEISRVFYTYDTSAGVKRGSHAHKTCWQLLVCVSGFMQVESTDTLSTKTFELNSPRKGLLIPPLIWSTQFGYSPGAVCLVLASEIYAQDEYINNFEDFVSLRQE